MNGGRERRERRCVHPAAPHTVLTGSLPSFDHLSASCCLRLRLTESSSSSSPLSRSSARPLVSTLSTPPSVSRCSPSSSSSSSSFETFNLRRLGRACSVAGVACGVTKCWHRYADGGDTMLLGQGLQENSNKIRYCPCILIACGVVHSDRAGNSCTRHSVSVCLAARKLAGQPIGEDRIDRV